MSPSQQVRVMASKHLRFCAGDAADIIAHLAALKVESTSVGHYKHMSKIFTPCLSFARSLSAGQSFGDSATLQPEPDWFSCRCIIPEP